MPAKLPGPSAGTCAQPAPNGWPAAALLEGAAELLAAEVLPDPDALLEPESDEHAARPMTTAAAAGRRAPRLRGFNG
jgi:hypothetical protein